MAEEWSLADDYAAFGDDLVPPMLPEGDYELLVLRGSPGKTSTNKPSLTWTFRITAGPMYPTEVGKPPKTTVGREVSEMMTWSPGNATAARIFAEQLGKLGASQKWIMDTHATFEQIALRCIGTKIKAKIKVDEEWNRNRVSLGRTVSFGPAAQGGAAGAATAAAGGTPATAAAQVPVSASVGAADAEALGGDDDLGSDWP